MTPRKKIIYSGFEDERSYVIDRLFKKHYWDPVCILALEHMQDWAWKNYEKAIFYGAMGLRNAKFDYSGIGEVVPVDAKIIGELSKYETYAYDLLEDTTGWNFSFHERKRYYYDLLRFWNTVVRRLEPDIFVSWTWPHTVTDYVLYQLLKYYKIPTLWVNPTPLFNYGENKYYHVSVSLEDQSRSLQPINKSDKVAENLAEIKPYFDSIRSKEGMTPPYIAYWWNNPEKHWSPRFWDKWTRECLRLGKLLLTGRFFEKMDVAWKCNKCPFESSKSKLNYFQFIVLQERIRLADKRLKTIYSAFITPADLNKKFIYYAAAFQPEAGIWSVYQDQLLVLDILSASIPDDWVIYYKEHPTEFMAGSRGSYYRDKNFYTKIAKYKNVRMISSEVNTFKLIDAAQAVATPSGTVGWESIVRGTPALIFGHTWYEDCSEVFKIEGFEDCLDAIEKIRNGYKPDQSAVESYVSAIVSVSGKNLIHGDFVADQIKASSNPQYEMERIADLYYEAYQRHYAREQSTFQWTPKELKTI